MFLAAVVSLTVLTFVVEELRKLETKTAPMVWDMISKILHQSVSRNVQVVINQKMQNLLPPWRRLLIMILTVLCNSYKGKVYTFIAHGIPFKWLDTSEDLLSDVEYKKISTDACNKFNRPKSEKFPMFPEFLGFSDNHAKTGPAQVSIFGKLSNTLSYLDNYECISSRKFGTMT